MGRIVCPRCDNAGVIFVKRQRQSGGKTTTEEVEEKCPRCKGQGWIDQ